MSNKLQSSQTFKSNPFLKKEGVQINYTQEQIENVYRYSNDPVAFIQENFKIVSLDKGLITIDLYDFQKDALKTIHENKFTIIRSPRQSSKCQHFNTNLTIRNKKTGEIKQISIGDFFEAVSQK